ncbi:MAG: RNA 2',3'-cyclic phosphodiesterase [Anaerolineales bacterium]|nr:RNA 2',3'-cyclic phosphodiesterase [Anaerolineales bacterium]
MPEPNDQVRAFIAIELPANLQQAIASATAGLQEALPRPLVRWVATQNVHLTIKFLGDVAPGNLERLAEALGDEAAAHHPFEASVGKLGAFPNPRRPRVIWVGLEAPASLLSLQRGVEAVCARMGFPAEAQRFHPHLTLGRLTKLVTAPDLERVQTALGKTEVGLLGKLNVNSIQIFKSDLKPGGPIYSRLHVLPLTTS